MRVQFDAVSAPAGLLGGEQRGAAASKCIQDNAASFRAIEDSVANQGKRFRRRVSGQRFVPVLAETAHAGIFPYICSAPSKAAEFNIVDVLGMTVLVNKNELVGAAV